MGRAAGVGGAAVLLGDFNTTRPEVEDRWTREPWRDVWPEVHPTRPGYTYDCDANTAAQTYRSRLDKIALKQGDSALRPVAVQLVGEPSYDEPARDDFSSPPSSPTAEAPLMASDHFGVLARFAF